MKAFKSTAIMKKKQKITSKEQIAETLYFQFSLSFSGALY